MREREREREREIKEETIMESDACWRAKSKSPLALNWRKNLVENVRQLFRVNPASTCTSELIGKRAV